jgi:hypothetical protein
MRRFITTILLGLTLSPFAIAGPSPIDINPGTLTGNPTIDAVIFQNSGIFQVSTAVTFSNVTTSADVLAGGLPFATRDTLYFTNSGTMIGVPGFRLDTATAKTRFSARDVANQGTIIGDDTPAFPDFFDVVGGTATTSVPQYSQPIPSQVLIFATNVINEGEIGVGDAGLLQIVARNFTNAYGSLAAGAVNTGGLNTVGISLEGVEGNTDPLDDTGWSIDYIDNLEGYYVNPPYVNDLIWGTTNGGMLRVDQLAGELPETPPMMLGFRGLFGLTGLGGSEVGGALENYASYLYTLTLSPTNVYYEIVLVNTNFADTNISANVRFSDDVFTSVPQPLFGDGVPPISEVQYSITTRDILTGDNVTNAIYLIDSGAQLTNIDLVDNASTANNYDRPMCFEITTQTPPEWEDGVSVPQSPFDPGLIYTPGSFINNSVPFIAGEYGAQIGRNPETLDGSFSASISQDLTGTNIAAIEDELFLGGGVTLPDPTNEAARIEVTAQQADLTAARIRAEGIVMLNITNLIGAGTGASDWGMTDASIGMTNGKLVLANFFPTNFQRVRGDLYAWSATWQNVFTNAVTTNNYHMHVLVVDQLLRGNFTPSIRNLSLNGSESVNVQNNLTVINQAIFDTSNLVLTANVNLTQGAGNVYPTNMPRLQSLFIETNASLTVDSVLDLGYSLTEGQTSPTKRKYTLSSIVNLGAITAGAPLFQSEFFTNDGTIEADDNGSLAINAAQLTLGSVSPFSIDELVAAGNITLSAESIDATNSVIAAGLSVGGSLVLDATGNLSDGVSGAPNPTPTLVNYWQVTDGFNLLVKPVTGDLFGTEIVTMANTNILADHIWAGVDMGASPAGFNNNAVIGHLVLDRLAPSGTLRFTGAGTKNAMYVDYLELTNYSYSDYRNGLIIDPNIKIYFANANADPYKLMEIYPGGLVWVTNFAGPNSTTAVPYLNSTNICLMNTLLATSSEIGFFGVPNAYNQPYVLNDPNDPSIVAPCPSDASAMQLFISAPTNSTSGGVYQSLIVSANGSGTVSPNLTSKQAEVGSVNTLTATPAKGWMFENWTLNGLAASSDAKSPVLRFTVGANSIITANFIPDPFTLLQGVYNGLFFDPNSVAADNSGFFTLTLNPSGAFSGRLLMGPSTYSFSSQFYGSGARQVQAASGKNSVTVNLQLDMTGATGQIYGDVDGGAWDSPLSANRAQVWTAEHPSPLAGNYTMILSGTSSIGDSFGVLTVSKLGVASVAGSLADGTGFSHTAPVSAGQWPFYAYAASARDTVLGWVDFSAADLSATNVMWSKAPNSTRYYAAGFDSVLQLIGSPYVAPPKNSPALSLVDPVVTLTGGNLSGDVTDPVTLQRNLGFASGQLTLTITNATGAFSGKIGHGQTMSGVVLQNQNVARGFFLGTNESGAVLLQGVQGN